MYQPAMQEETIMTLYRMKRAYKKPMTILLQELLVQAVKTINREEVCNKCRQEQNTSCEQCLFN